MKKERLLLVFVLFCVCSIAQVNIDFESGDFSGWTGGIGYNKRTHFPLTIVTNSITTSGINSAETSCSFHTLVNTGTDSYSGLPVVRPGGGSWSCRLGGEFLNIACDVYNSSTPLYAAEGGIAPSITTCRSTDPVATNTASPDFGEAYSNGETLEQTFNVTSANCIFSYNYSVVMANSPHVGDTCNYFNVQVFDQSGNLIPCLSLHLTPDTTGAGAVPTGFLGSSINDVLGNSVIYCPWTKKSIDLQPYLGQNITIRFTASGCCLGGHFAYAYIDCDSGPLQINASSTSVCAAGNYGILTAPPASNYSWSGPGISGPNNTQSIHINTAGTYSLNITGIACSYSASLSINVTSSTVTPVSVNITGGNTICNGNYDTLVAIGATSYTWSANAGYNDTAIVHPTSSITIYTVTGMTSGCYATDTIKVNIDQIPFGMFNIVQDALPNTWDAYPTYSSNVAYCKWDWGDSSSTYGLYPNHIYTNPGRYNICMTVYTGYCNDSTVYCLSDSLYRVAINVGNTPVYVNVLHSTTGVNMLTNFNNNIAVHPNPAENQITVQSSPELGSIVINNSLGEVIFQVVSKNASEQIDISKFPAGMYFIEAKNKRIKLIKN